MTLSISEADFKDNLRLIFSVHNFLNLGQLILPGMWVGLDNCIAIAPIIRDWTVIRKKVV